HFHLLQQYNTELYTLSLHAALPICVEIPGTVLWTSPTECTIAESAESMRSSVPPSIDACTFATAGRPASCSPACGCGGALRSIPLPPRQGLRQACRCHTPCRL